MDLEGLFCFVDSALQLRVKFLGINIYGHISSQLKKDHSIAFWIHQSFQKRNLQYLYPFDWSRLASSQLSQPGDDSLQVVTLVWAASIDS